MKKLLLFCGLLLLFSCKKEQNTCGRIASVRLISVNKLNVGYYEVVLKYPNNHLSNVIGIYSEKILRIGNVFCE